MRNTDLSIHQRNKESLLGFSPYVNLAIKIGVSLGNRIGELNITVEGS